jgi:hypothetical protein
VVAKGTIVIPEDVTVINIIITIIEFLTAVNMPTYQKQMTDKKHRKFVAMISVSGNHITRQNLS